jgi:hypothetical protein
MYFLFMNKCVESKHRTKMAAHKHLKRILIKYPNLRHYHYTIKQLSSPGYWERGDTPHKRYHLSSETIWGANS